MSTPTTAAGNTPGRPAPLKSAPRSALDQGEPAGTTDGGPLVLPADPDLPVPYTVVTADDDAGKATRKGEATLSSDVLGLLAAIRDALDVPLSALTDADERARARILNERVSSARIAVAGILDNGHDVPNSAAYLAERTADTPVTYTVWQPRRRR